MSVEAISWALNLAPVLADRGGQPSTACKFVLVGLANHAGPDGTGAFPSVATLVRYTGLSERTVRTCLDRLEAEGIDLADAWLVTAEQRARLAPAVKAALDMGWTPSSPAAFTGANIDGVRSPYAVLTSRLSPAELPRPIGHGPPRPPWCGQCDQATRMLGFDGDSPRPCPRCKPGTASGREPVMSRTGPGAIAESV